VTSVSWRALGTTATVAVTRTSALDKARDVVEAELAAIDRTCSRFRTDSELANLNAAQGKVSDVSPLLLEAVTVALEAARATDGLVDPTVGRTLRLSGYDATFAVIRTRTAPQPTSFACDSDWRAIQVDRRHARIRLPRRVELDLGATAKALAADRAAQAAFESTQSGVLVSLGGDIAVAGDPPPGGWSIRIADDHAASLDVSGPTVLISTGGLATSGTSVRRWRTSVGELHHIVDPRTGRSASGCWRTVTVAASSCLAANTASTAAIVLGDAAVSWLTELGLPARLVRQDGVVRRVADWPADVA
jgi:FAD:protein FMN transferase